MSTRYEQIGAGLEVLPDLLTVREAGVRLGLKRSAVYALLQRGQLVAVHPTPGSTRITSRSVDAHLARIGAVD
jgi:excisionase family DNA binding protein